MTTFYAMSGNKRLSTGRPYASVANGTVLPKYNYKGNNSVKVPAHDTASLVSASTMDNKESRVRALVTSHLQSLKAEIMDGHEHEHEHED